jgi:hypothetical protein
LVRCQLRRASHVDATGLGTRPAFARSGLDKLRLEFSQATKHRQHQTAVAVVVSAHASANDLNVAPALLMASRMLRRSRVPRASLSSQSQRRHRPRHAPLEALATPTFRVRPCGRQPRTGGKDFRPREHISIPIDPGPRGSTGGGTPDVQKSALCRS